MISCSSNPIQELLNRIHSLRQELKFRENFEQTDEFILTKSYEACMDGYFTKVSGAEFLKIVATETAKIRAELEQLEAKLKRMEQFL